MNNRGNKQGPTIRTDPMSLPIHICDCGSDEFLEVRQMRRCPALLSPTGQPTLILLPHRIACARCGAQAMWKLDEQPKIINMNQEKRDVSDLSVEGDVPPPLPEQKPEGGEA